MQCLMSAVKEHSLTTQYWNTYQAACLRTQQSLCKLLTSMTLLIRRLSTGVQCNSFHSRRYATETITLPTTYSQNGLPADANEIPTPSSIAYWEHLNSLKDEIGEFDKSITIGLLIGANCPKALEHCESIPSYASEILTYKDTTFEELLRRAYAVDFCEEEGNGRGLSVEDRQFLEMKENVKMDNGHYCLPLPFRLNDEELPNNKGLAVRRMESTRRKMLKDSTFAKEYVAFMENLFTKGYATEVKVEERTKAKGVWYMPHHGVLHPTKGKLRVLFDCAATFQSQSLNKALLSGPDLTNSVTGVLTRFRKELIPFTADIESMFYQVPECQQSYLRFFVVA